MTPYFPIAGNPPKIDAKCGDHCRQAGLWAPIPSLGSRINFGKPNIRTVRLHSGGGNEFLTYTYVHICIRA